MYWSPWGGPYLFAVARSETCMGVTHWSLSDVDPLGMKLRTQRRIALGALIAVALLAIAYGVYWCMEPGKVHDATTDVPPIAGAR